MNTISRSPLEYQRMKDIRDVRQLPLNDRPMTATPRYGKKTARTHRRGETRMGRWLKYV
jgi:hypothetical protein